MKGHTIEDHPENDHTLIRQSIQGDLSAFRRLVERHQHYVYSLAFRSLLHRQEAEDIVQDTFIKVWLNLSFFNFRGKFTTWVYRIVVNLCIDRLKSKNRFTDYQTSSADNSQDWMNQQDEMKKLEEKDMAEHIKMLADHLSPKQRMVFILRDLQDLKIEEVCQVMQLSEGSVKTNLYHARNAIRLNLIKTEER
ncbi:MAG: RNA polymerase sigma factor [Bacteroidales bacterium]|nr:RNA polymerase sigma factor [Bacteroidales bacterium]